MQVSEEDGAWNETHLSKHKKHVFLKDEYKVQILPSVVVVYNYSEPTWPDFRGFPQKVFESLN